MQAKRFILTGKFKKKNEPKHYNHTNVTYTSYPVINTNINPKYQSIISTLRNFERGNIKKNEKKHVVECEYLELYSGWISRGLLLNSPKQMKLEK